MDFRLARIQKLRRAEAFSRHRASVEHPTRRRADSEGRRARRLCRAEGVFRFQMPIQQTSRLSGWTSRLVCTQRPRRAEAFSRRRASVDRPTRRRADSEGRRARRLCRAEGVFSVSNIHIANESALRFGGSTRLFAVRWFYGLLLYLRDRMAL